MSKLTKEDLAKIMEVLQEAYKKAGKKLTSAELYHPNETEPEILLTPKIDPEDLN